MRNAGSKNSCLPLVALQEEQSDACGAEPEKGVPASAGPKRGGEPRQHKLRSRMRARERLPRAVVNPEQAAEGYRKTRISGAQW